MNDNEAFGNYTVCFDGHLPLVVYCSSFKQAVEVAMLNINSYCCRFSGEAPVDVYDLDAVFLS